ncbi:MAG: hypothetical protein SFX74_07460 [Fimbriimonadaceae bacterium]|nr:hypothetical protein [Fimbriimonadaceae bacterium]
MSEVTLRTLTQRANRGQEVRRRAEDFAAFRTAYLRVGEYLREGLRYGPWGIRPSDYRDARHEYLNRYESVGSYVRRFLPTLGPDDFSALVASQSPARALARDPRAIRAMLERTQLAMDRYAEHLAELQREAA